MSKVDFWDFLEFQNEETRKEIFLHTQETEKRLSKRSVKENRPGREDSTDSDLVTETQNHSQSFTNWRKEFQVHSNGLRSSFGFD